MYMTMIVKQGFWYISQISGERLQDHWSAGLLSYNLNVNFIFISLLITAGSESEAEVKSSINNIFRMKKNKTGSFDSFSFFHSSCFFY